MAGYFSEVISQNRHSWGCLYAEDFPWYPPPHSFFCFFLVWDNHSRDVPYSCNTVTIGNKLAKVTREKRPPSSGCAPNGQVLCRYRPSVHYNYNQTELHRIEIWTREPSQSRFLPIRLMCWCECKKHQP